MGNGLTCIGEPVVCADHTACGQMRVGEARVSIERGPAQSLLVVPSVGFRKCRHYQMERPL